MLDKTKGPDPVPAVPDAGPQGMPVNQAPNVDIGVEIQQTLGAMHFQIISLTKTIEVLQREKSELRAQLAKK